jgi:hypothetical protein
LSNIEASEENVKSSSTYGNNAYEEYRKKRRKTKMTQKKSKCLSKELDCVLESLKIS